jgi:hypothetical protein
LHVRSGTDDRVPVFQRRARRRVRAPALEVGIADLPEETAVIRDEAINRRHRALSTGRGARLVRCRLGFQTVLRSPCGIRDAVPPDVKNTSRGLCARPSSLACDSGVHFAAGFSSCGSGFLPASSSRSSPCYCSWASTRIRSSAVPLGVCATDQPPWRRPVECHTP